MRKSLSFSFVLFWILFSCKSSHNQVRPQQAKQAVNHYSSIEKTKATQIYQHFLSAVNPSGKNLPEEIKAIGTYIDGNRKIPIQFSVKKNSLLSISLAYGGQKYFPVRYNAGRIILLDNRPPVKNETHLAEELHKFTVDPLGGIFGYYIRQNIPFHQIDIRKINGVEVNNIVIRDGRYEWRFYFDKKTGFPVKWEKYNENGILFALDFMDFRNTKGYWLSHHMIATDKNNKKTTYIWHKFIIH